jgi:coatomer subunit beta
MRLIKSRNKDNVGVDQDMVDLIRATGSGAEQDVYVSRLERIFPLTGYSDPIYAEAYITIHQFDILLGPFLFRLIYRNLDY